RLLAGEAHGEETLAALGARELRGFRGHQQVLDEARTEALERARDALALEQVDADAEDHARAVSMSCFISRTAAARPTCRAWLMGAWRMLSWTIGVSAATGCTLW